MEKTTAPNPYSFFELAWDTKYFGCRCAKAVLNGPMTAESWAGLGDKLRNYQFVSIENRNSEPVNAQLLGSQTSAFLADVNIQFYKKLSGIGEKPPNITVRRGLDFHKTVADMAVFRFSKFTEDPELKRRGGEQVYREWVINSFGNPDKFFVLSGSGQDEINGFLLFSIQEAALIIELIAVSDTVAHSGVGTSLFLAAEYEAVQHGCEAVKVGTQLRNTGAINFYFKNGCIQTGCHQTYHLWNL